MCDSICLRASLLPRCAGLLLVIALLGGSPLIAADSLRMLPKFDAAPAYFEYSTDVAQKMPGPTGGDMEVEVRSIYGVLMSAAPGESGAEVSSVLDRLYGFMLFRSDPGTEGVRSQFDSDDPESEDASPDHRAAFGPLLSRTVKVTLDGKGDALAVDGGEAIRKHLLGLGEQNFVAKSLADGDFSDAQIMTVFGELPVVLLPYREVKVGENWKKTQQDIFPQVGRVNVNYDCTLERIEGPAGGEIGILRFTGTVTKDVSEQPAEGKRLGNIAGTFSGTARFSAAQGRVVEIARDMKALIEVPPFWTNNPSAPLMKIDAKIADKLTVTPAADRAKKKEESAKRSAAARAQRDAEEAEAMAGPVEPETAPNAPEAWLQWGGPNRDFCSSATGLANRWPKDGPPRLWERPLGDGFSAILCDGDTLYTTYSLRDKGDPFTGDEVIVALDAKTGATRWEHKYPAPWPRDLQMEFGPGPHSTPLIVGERLFSVGSTAQLVCLDKSSGKPIWTRDLLKEHDAALNMRGYGSSPLAYKGNILLPVSGKKGSALIAFSQADGSIAWQGGEFEPGYASLFVIHAFGGEQLVAFTGKAICGLEPGTARTLWSVAQPTQFGANISTPVWSAADHLLFISAAYGMGSRGIQLEKKGDEVTAREAWTNNKMKIQHANAVRVGDWVYGSSGDFGPAFLCSVNAKTGEFGWRRRGIAKANVLSADGKLIVFDEDGTLLLVKADGTKYRLLGKASGLCEKTAWTVPTLHGRTLYLRDRKKILALNLGAAGPS